MTTSKSRTVTAHGIFNIIAMKPHIKEVLCRDVLEMFCEDEEYRIQFERENNMAVLDEYEQLTESAFERYYALMISSTEQIYNQIFWGSYAPQMFQSDISAMNWFLHLYK